MYWKVKGKIIFSILLAVLLSLGTKLAPAAEIIYINKDYKAVAIDLGSEDGQLVPGLKLHILSPQGIVKGTVEIRRVGKYASAGKIIEEFYEIQTGDKIKLFENTAVPNLKILPYERKFLLNKKNFSSFLKNHPQIKAIKYQRELFRDEVKKADIKFFPTLDFQKLRGHALQEGRKVRGKYLLDVIPEWGLLYFRLPFEEIAKKNYYIALMGKMELELEKQKAELTIEFLKLLHLYISNLNEIKDLTQELINLTQELKLLKNQKNIYPYLIKRLATKILEKEKLLNIQKNKIEELKIKLTLFLNLSPETKVIIPEPEELYSELKESLEIPEYGYNYLLAQQELKVKQAQYILSKLKIRPTFEYKLAYPSYVSTFKLIIPIKGITAIKAAEIEKEQAKYILEKEELFSHYKIKKINTRLYYLTKLLERYQNFNSQVLKITPSYWQDRLDQEEKLSNLKDRIQKIKFDLEENQLELLRYGNLKTEPEILITPALPSLENCLEYAEQNSPELKYLQLETQKSFKYLEEAKAQHNQPKSNFFKDEYIYKASLRKLKVQELQNRLLKSYLELILSHLNYRNSFEYLKIYRREWEIKKEEKKLRAYLIKSAEFAWEEELIKQLEKKMKQDLAFIDFKYLLSNLDHLQLKNEFEINPQILKQVEKTIPRINFDSNLRQRIEKFKVLLATDKVEIAKRGYFITGPWELVYNPKKIPSHGRRGSDWKKIGKGVEFLDWLKLYIPTGIIYRTPFGNKIHDVKIAYTNLEIAKIKSNQAMIEEEHLRNLILEKFTFMKNAFEESKKLVQEVKSRYLETKSKLKTFRASEEELLGAKRIFLDKELQYLNKFKLYLESKVDLYDRGYPESRFPIKVKPLPKILTRIPKLEIVEKEAEIVKEKYKKALKLNFKDYLRLGIFSGGPWFILQIAPDINLIRARHLVKETPLWMEKANVDADLEYQNWLTRIQTSRAKIRLQNLVLKKIKTYLNELQNEISLSIAPYSHYIELKILEDKIRNEIQSEKQEMLYAVMRLKTLMGIPPEEELIIPEIEIQESRFSKLTSPEILIRVVTHAYPDIKLKKSHLYLAYKEKKWDGFLRNLKFGTDFFCDFILSRTYAWNITFAVFDLYLNQLGYYYQDKIQYQNLILGIERLKIKKNIYLDYYLIKKDLLRAKEYKKILENYEELLDSAWQAYLNKEIPWESEYGILKILTQVVEIQNQYIDTLHEYIYKLSYYNQLEKKFLSEEAISPSSIQAPFGLLTLENLNLRNLFIRIKNNLSLFKNFRKRQKIYTRNIEDWNEKEQKRNFNLWVYNIQKNKHKEKLEKIAQIYTEAQEIEYRSFLVLEKIWAQDYQAHLELKQKIKDLLSPPYEISYKKLLQETILILKPNLSSKLSLFMPFDEDDLYNGLTNYFLKYLRQFRFSEKEIDLFFHYLPEIASLWEKLRQGKKIKLPNWWSKYSGGFSYLFLLPYFEPEDINQLGLISHYALVAVYNQEQIYPQSITISKEILEKLNRRLHSESKFLLLNLRKVSENILSDFLRWQDYIIKEIDRVSFQHYSFEEMEKLRQEIAKLKVPFWEYIEGNKLEEQIQMDIIRWLIATGIEDKTKIFKLFEVVPQILYKIYTPPSLEEISYTYDAVRLRYLIKNQNINLANLEYTRVKRSYMLGLLLFWLNKILIEKIELPELKEIVYKIKALRDLPEFSKLYGKHPLTDERYLFYQHSLIYYAQKFLKTDLQELQNKFSWMNLLKTNPNFISLYGKIDLNSEFLYEKYSIYKLTHYIGSLTFWANWAYENKFSRDFVIKFLTLYNKSLNSPKFLTTLEYIYNQIGIKINLNLKQPSYEMEEEVKGLLSNWVLYFYLRGTNTLDKMFLDLDEIKKIAQLSYKNQLNYTQDDLRYWFQHKNEQGYQIEDLEEIFNIMAEIKNLLATAVKEIYQDPQLKSIIGRISPYLEEIKNKKMLKGEIQRLAEEIIYPQKIPVRELIQEYKIGILIQTLYISELNIELTPLEVTEIFNFIKKEGLEIKDLINLVKIMKPIYLKLKQENSLNIFSEPELRKFIWQINYERGWEFTRRYFKNWLPKLIFFLKQFQKEHHYYPSKRLIFSLLDPHNVKAPDWQLKRLISKGSLSQEANDITLINLGKERNIQRELLFTSYDKLILGLELDKLNSYLNYFQDLDLYQLQWLLNYEKKFEENLSWILLSEIKENFLKRLKEIIQVSLPMLSYLYLNQNLYKKRIKIFSERTKNGFKEITPNTEIQYLLKSPQKRIKLIKRLRKETKQKYNFILSPARTYALLWKIREGYPLEDALKVFIKWYQELKEIYKDTLNRKIKGEVNNLLLHLCQQIYLTPLKIEDLKETFLILRELRRINYIKKIKIPEIKLYRDAEMIYFTGLTHRDLNIIYEFLTKVNKYFSPQNWQKLLYIILRSFNSQLYHTPPLELYSYQNYIEVLNLPKVKTEKLIPLLYRGNISPLSFCYFYFQAETYRKELGLNPKLKNSILASLLYEKTKDPEVVKLILDLKTEISAYAYLKKINKIVDRKKKEVIKNKLLKKWK